MARYIDDEQEDDEDVCRICRTPGDADNPLQYPCACRGSIKFVHQDCLLQWLSYSKAHRCEVCKHHFSFSPLYDEKAPTRLPLKEFVVGIAMKVWRCRVSHASLRLSLMLLACLLTVSFITFWTWRLAFVQSFVEARRLFLSHMSTLLVLTDCLLGFLVSATIIFILLKAASLRNFFRHLGRNFLFNELVRIQSPLFHLAMIVFVIVACNMIFVGVVIFVPFTLGRVILHHVAAADLLKGFVAVPSKLYDDVTTLTVANMFAVFLYLGIIVLIRYFKGQQPLNFDRLYGVAAASIIETIPPLLRQLLVGIKVGTMVAYYFGVFPLMCGWWLDVCTVSMFGETMSNRVEFLSVSPLARSLVHWAVGVLYLSKICICEDLLLKVLRREALFFLYDPKDDDDVESFQFMIEEPVHKLARDVLLDAAKYGSLIVLLVFLPVKLAIMMAPSVFPLDISVSDPFTEIPVGILLFTICTQFIIEHFGLWTTVKSLVRCWFTSVCWALGLTDLLLPRPEDKVGQDNGDGEPGRQNRGPERAMDVLPATVDPNRSLVLAGNVEKSHSEYIFVLRVVLLLLAAWVTPLLFNTALIVVPVSLGRALFNAIPTFPITHGIKCNDLYGFVIGTYAFWIIISGTMYATEHLKSERTSVLLNQIWRWCGIVFKSSVLLAIWIFIIPVLIALVLELLVIVPMRVPVDETPVFLLYQDWALGFIFLKIWTTLIILLDDSWKAKFERVEEDGFSRLQGLWVLKEIVSPILMKLLTALCVPYVLAKGVFPMLGCPLVVNSAVYRFAWIGCLSASFFFSCAKRCHVWFINLHNSIRDDHYLVGRRLLNFEEVALAKRKSSASEDDGEGDGDT
ncbi:PREDICTED: probable E3 ubiquitin ligase SUD1 [Brassica oleracea var. oleracea]|uniref:probable E3 ubiquitin ligase SUD1 n=1 Tax=Brassica oleracea var. oleracea TaxID=109376 RepID=UPI0006A73A8A|nr:PREDICTED: probable E3 ubiquitin ligase SUD1 [Brassica oleracea var. oleracea]